MLRKIIPAAIVFCSLATPLLAQRVRESSVPATVKTALAKRYPSATAVTWEKEKGNFEANWGGRSGEDNSVLFTPTGEFIETVTAISVATLPPAVAAYVHEHYPGAKITEAGKITDAKGAIGFEAEVKGKDLRFDEKGNFLTPS